MRIFCCLDLNQMYDPVPFQLKKGLERYCKLPGHLLGLLSNRIKGCWLARCSAEDVSKMHLTPDHVRHLSERQLTFLRNDNVVVNPVLLAECQARDISVNAILLNLSHTKFAALNEPSLQNTYNTLHRERADLWGNKAINELSGFLAQLELRPFEKGQHFRFLSPVVRIILLQKMLERDHFESIRERATQICMGFQEVDPNISKKALEILRLAQQRNQPIPLDAHCFKKIAMHVDAEQLKAFLEPNSPLAQQVMEYLLKLDENDLIEKAKLLLNLAVRNPEMFQKSPTPVLLGMLKATSLDQDAQIKTIFSELLKRNDIQEEQLINVLEQFQKENRSIELSQKDFNRLVSNCSIERLLGLLALNVCSPISTLIRVYFFEEHLKEMSELLKKYFAQLDTQMLLVFALTSVVKNQYVNNLSDPDRQFNELLKRLVDERFKEILLDPKTDIHQFKKIFEDTCKALEYPVPPLDITRSLVSQTLRSLSSHEMTDMLKNITNDSLNHMIFMYRNQRIDGNNAKYLKFLFAELANRTKGDLSFHLLVRALFANSDESWYKGSPDFQQDASLSEIQLSIAHIASAPTAAS